MLVVIVLANIRCTTTTRASVGSPDSRAWFAAYDNCNATVRFRPPWNSSLSGQLTRESQTLPSVELPPAQTRLKRSSDERAIPLEWVSDVKVVNHARGAGEWALLGAAAGFAFGIVFVVSVSDYGRNLGCSEGRSCHDRDLLRAIGGGLGYGVLFSGPIGAAGGALLGGVMGHRYVLTFD